MIQKKSLPQNGSYLESESLRKDCFWLWFKSPSQVLCINKVSARSNWKIQTSAPQTGSSMSTWPGSVAKEAGGQVEVLLLPAETQVLITASAMASPQHCSLPVLCNFGKTHFSASLLLHALTCSLPAHLPTHPPTQDEVAPPQKKR